MGLEFNVVAEFSRLTKPQLRMIANWAQAQPFVEDAQPHSKHYSNPVVESEEDKGRHYDKRRISFFVIADDAESASKKVNGICERAVKAGMNANYFQDVKYAIKIVHAALGYGRVGV